LAPPPSSRSPGARQGARSGGLAPDGLEGDLPQHVPEAAARVFGRKCVFGREELAVRDHRDVRARRAPREALQAVCRNHLRRPAALARSARPPRGGDGRRARGGRGAHKGVACEPRFARGEAELGRLARGVPARGPPVPAQLHQRHLPDGVQREDVSAVRLHQLRRGALSGTSTSQARSGARCWRAQLGPHGVGWGCSASEWNTSDTAARVAASPRNRDRGRTTLTPSPDQTWRTNSVSDGWACSEPAMRPRQRGKDGARLTFGWEPSSTRSPEGMSDLAGIQTR